MTIVIDLQKLKDNGTGKVVGLKDMQINTFGLESAKEALHDSVVVTVTGAAHADSDVVLSEQILVGVGSILAAAI